MTPKLLEETAGMIGMKELRDAFKEVTIKLSPSSFSSLSLCFTHCVAVFSCRSVRHGWGWGDHHRGAEVCHD